MSTAPPLRATLLWVLACVAGEALGQGLSVGWAIALLDATPAEASLPAMLAAAGLQAASGLLEGAVLGTLQARALRRLYPRLPAARFAIATALAMLAASVVLALIRVALFRAEIGLQPLFGAFLAGVLGLPFGAAIGAAQHTALREAADRSSDWIAASALAWMLALPAASLTNSSGTLPAVLANAMLGGGAIGLVLGATTAYALRFLPPRA